MSLSSDFKAANSRRWHNFSEHHPVMLTFGAIAGLVAVLVLFSRFYF